MTRSVRTALQVLLAVHIGLLSLALAFALPRLVLPLVVLTSTIILLLMVEGVILGWRQRYEQRGRTHITYPLSWYVQESREQAKKRRKTALQKLRERRVKE